MKRIISILFILILPLISMPDLKTYACGCSCGGKKSCSDRDFPRIAIVGIVAGGLAVITKGSLYIADKIIGLPKLSYSDVYWTNLADFGSKTSVTESELNNYISKSSNQPKLLTEAIRAANKGYGSNFYNVNNEKASENFQKAVLIEDTQIENKSMHLYSVKFQNKLPEDHDKLTVEAILLYDLPDLKDNNKSPKIDFNVFKNTESDKIIKNISNNRSMLSGKISEQTKITEIATHSYNSDRRIGIIKKEFQVKSNSINPEKPLILEISSQNYSKKEDKKKYIQTYAAILSIKPTKSK